MNRITLVNPPWTPELPATGAQAHDRSRELEFGDRLRSALPRWPSSQISRFAEEEKWSLPLRGSDERKR